MSVLYTMYVMVIFTYLSSESLFAFYLFCFFECKQTVFLLFMGVRNIYFKLELYKKSSLFE